MHVQGFQPSAAPQSDDYSEELNRYAECMEELKRRTDVLLNFSAGRLSTGYIQTDVETMCLQMRKILELIALASLVANKREYALQYEKFANHWHATKILEDIEAINPNFWPIPTKQMIDPRTGKVTEVVNVTEGFLRREDLVAIYDECSEAMHAENPYAPKPDIVGIRGKIATWMNQVIVLLNHHQIQLVDPNLQIWVLMRAEDDGRVKTVLMKNLGKTPENEPAEA